MLTYYGQDFLTNVMAGRSVMPTTLYLALLTQVPLVGQDGTSIAAYEPSGGSYARVAVAMDNTTWSAASSGISANSVAITFPTATGIWGVMSAYAFCTAATAGQVLWAGSLSQSLLIESGANFVIAPGALTLRMAG